MEKKLASQRVLGRDSKGREVLVAAPGQPIDEKRFKVEGAPATTTSETEAAAAAEVDAEPTPSGEAEAEGAKAPGRRGARKGR